MAKRKLYVTRYTTLKGFEQTFVSLGLRSREHRFTHMNHYTVDIPFLSKACNESYEQQLPDFDSWALTAGILLNKVLLFSNKRTRL